MEKHLLSKSTFIRGLQCHKSLYLNKYHYKLRDPLLPERRAIFDRGNKIGEMARQLFPGGVDVSSPGRSKYLESVKKTGECIEKGEQVIYEAAFQYKQVLSAIDILVKKDGKYYAYEVKSSTRISPTYIMDVSLQYYVITQSGLELEDVFIVHVNNQYVRKGAIEWDKLFKLVSVKKKVLENQPAVEEEIGALKNVLSLGEIPEIKIGTHCRSPYDCDFLGNCWKNVPDNSVFDIAGMSKQEQFELYDSGIMKMDEISNTASLGNAQRIQVESCKNGKPRIDKKGLNNFLSGLKYPLFFVDFETMMPAIPIYDGSVPFMQIPFQYSIHYMKQPGAEPEHIEFLAEHGTDPRWEFVDNFLRDTEKQGDILVYNITFEKRILAIMQKRFPERKAEIDKRIGRMKDLMEPFSKKQYYAHEMKGKYSIKNVLPALVPELSYKELDIANGRAAMGAFEDLYYETDLMKIAQTRDALLEYCKMDTYAMVRILQVLEEVVA